MNKEAEGLYQGDITVVLLADDNTAVTSNASHMHFGEISPIKMQVELKEGTYRLLSATVSKEAD